MAKESLQFKWVACTHLLDIPQGTKRRSPVYIRESKIFIQPFLSECLIKCSGDFEKHLLEGVIRNRPKENMYNEQSSRSRGRGHEQHVPRDRYQNQSTRGRGRGAPVIC